jgi:hypothetical protein
MENLPVVAAILTASYRLSGPGKELQFQDPRDSVIDDYKKFLEKLRAAHQNFAGASAND